MKIAKYIITFFLFFLFLCSGSEFFQFYLSNFQNDFYFFSVNSAYPDISHNKSAKEVISEAADSYSLYLFCLERSTPSPYKTSITIYADPNTQEMLSDRYTIIPESEKSFFSGVSEITFNPLSNYLSINKEPRIYVTGTKEQASSVRNYINRFFPCSYIHKEEKTGLEYAIYAIGILICLLLLLLTWLDIQFQKKKDFLLISLGKDITSIVLLNMLADTAAYLLISLTLWKILRRHISLIFCAKPAVFFFLVFLLLNSILYLSLFSADYKEIIYGANINEKNIANGYILKVMIMIVALVSISVNIRLINNNTRYLNCYDQINEVKNFSEVSLIKKSMINNLDAESLQYNEITAEFFSEMYNRGDALLAVHNADIQDKMVLLMNDNAKAMISDTDLLKKVDPQKTIHLLAPQKLSDEEISFLLEVELKYYMGQESSECDYDVVQYDNIHVIYFDLGTGSKTAAGFEIADNPIIFWTTSKIKINPLHINNQYDMTDDILYRVNDSFDLKEIDKNYALSHRSILDICNEYKDVMKRIVLLNTVISIFLLGIEITIISTLTRFEYTINAKELAIKKVLGHSLLIRNRNILVLNLCTALISISTIVIISLMYKIITLTEIIITGINLLLIETVIIIVNLVMLERRHTAEIIKGGCL